MNAYIFPNLDKTNCREYTIGACQILNQENVSIYMDKCYQREFSLLGYINFSDEDICVKSSDIVVVIGGDGTILKCANIAAVYDKPILGINCGRLGFMASLEHSELEMLRCLCHGKYTLSRRMMLKVEVICDNGVLLDFNALNDVVISKSDDCKIVDFEVTKSGQVISSLRADGIIFSTATGATAYSLSAGGPIIEPNMECIEFTQICPHSLFARSMLLLPDSVLEVKCHCNNNTNSVVNVDGNIVYKLSNTELIRISKSDLYLSIIDITGGSFFTSINKKLMQPLKETLEEN